MKRGMNRFIGCAALVFVALSTVAPVLAQQPVASPVERVEPDQAPSPVKQLPVERDTTRAMGEGMHDLSPWTMFLNADWLVKAVMCGLAFASLVTWTVLVAKTIEIARAKRGLAAALSQVEIAHGLVEAQSRLTQDGTVLSSFLAAVELETQLSSGVFQEAGIKERAASSFSEIMKSEAAAIRRSMGLLATIGATSPFVGLFGTVWGIMNSFIGISKSQTTNLAVVAPGIAEALLATACGLVAAIPAVIFYNHFTRATKSYLDMVGRAAGVSGRLLSRDLDRVSLEAREKEEA